MSKKIKTPKRFKWTVSVEIEVAPIWVADGYFPDKERIEADIRAGLGYAYESEMKVRSKITSGPTQGEINAWLKDSDF